MREVPHSSLSPKEVFPLPEVPSDGAFEGDFGSHLFLSVGEERSLEPLEHRGREMGQDARGSIHVDVSQVDDEEPNAGRENTP